jgi:hypothetical protein
MPESEMTWNLQDNLDKATRVSQRARRGKLYRAMSIGIEVLYDRLDSGESIEEIAIDVDIRAAGGALSHASHKFWRGVLEAIRVDRERKLVAPKRCAA